MTWYAATGTSALIGNGRKARWNGTSWLIGGQPNFSNSLLYSSDGVNWAASSSATSLLDIVCNGMDWDGKKWIAVGRGSVNQMISSTDGITWSAVSSADSFVEMQDIVWNGTLWVACAQYSTGKFHYSYDGFWWYNSPNATTVVGPTFGYGFCLAWNGTRFVGGAFREDGYSTMIYSSDGISWTASASGTAIINGEVRAVAWNGRIFVAGGFKGGSGTSCLAYSTDGITWTASSNGNTIFSGGNGVTSVTWNGSLWVAGGDGTTNRYATSVDGITWTANASGNALTSANLPVLGLEARRIQNNSGQMPIYDRQQGRTEIAKVTSVSSSTFTANFIETATYFFSSVNQNFTLNVTNIPREYGATFTIRLLIEQGVTGYIPNAIQIDGGSVSLRWLNNTPPTPGTSRTDLITFLFNITGGWTVLGELKSYA